MREGAIKLSELPSYRAYGHAVGMGDEAAAVGHARDALEIARASGDPHACVTLLLCIGDSEARRGQRAESEAAFAEAAVMDPASPLPVLLWARCLAAIMRDMQAAEAKLAEASVLVQQLRDTEVLLPYYETITNEIREQLSRR